MSALGQKRTLVRVHMMSALPPKADIGTHSRDVCFVPKADIPRCGRSVVIRLSRQRLRVAFAAQLARALSRS